MTDKARATIDDLTGRPNEPGPASRSSNEPNQIVSIPEAVRLALAVHLRGLERAGVIDERSVSTIAGALERSDIETAAAAPIRTFQEMLEERVDSGLPEEIRGAVTLGLAHEEWSGTALRLVGRAGAVTLATAAIEMQRAMLAVAELHAVTLMQGFHTGQPVQPITFGVLLGGAIAPVGSSISRLLNATDGFNRCPLGAGSMAGEVVGAERSETADWLGFQGPIPNTYDAVSNVEDFAAVADAVASITAPASRLVGELATMARTDPSSLVFDESWMRSGGHHLPAFSATERLLSLSHELDATVVTVRGLVDRLRRLPYGPLGPAMDWIVADVTSLCQDAGSRFASVEEMFRSAMTVNRAYLANRAGRGHTTSNDLAAFLMHEEQLSPVTARNIAGLTIRRLREENVEISAITPDHVDTAAMLVIGRELKVEAETLGRWFAPRRFLERRQAEGSPAPARTRDWIASVRDETQRQADRLEERRSRIRDAEEGVRRWVSDHATAGDAT